MTDAEILQSKIDHYFDRDDIVRLVKSGTPTRWSKPLTRWLNGSRRNRRRSVIHDYANDHILVIEW